MKSLNFDFDLSDGVDVKRAGENSLNRSDKIKNKKNIHTHRLYLTRLKILMRSTVNRKSSDVKTFHRFVGAIFTFYEL